MDLLNVEYNLIEAKRAYIRFTYKKKCCVCQTPISDKVFTVYYAVLRRVPQRKRVPPGLRQERQEHHLSSHQARLLEDIQILIILWAIVSN